MVAVGSFLLVLALSLIVVRVGAVALMMTGLSEEVAQFQALSAFSGTGFTTTETEGVVSHPARRKTVALLIRFGSAGGVTAISTLMLSLIGAGKATPERLLVLLPGVCILLWLARSRSLYHLTTPLVKRLLSRYTTLELHDYADLLHLHEDYRIVEIDIEPDSWLASKQLGKLSLPDEGVQIIGVLRTENDYIGAPSLDYRLNPGDRLVVYGRKRRLQELSTRHSNEETAHDLAKAEHEKDVKNQEKRLSDSQTD